MERPGPPPDPPAALAVAEDPDGRVVVLTAERWGHILDGHPEVVLHYRGARGRIVTAFARRALPARP